MIKAAFDAARDGKRVDVRRRVTIAQVAFDDAIRTLAAPFYRVPRNARAILGVTRIKRVRARIGYALDTQMVRRRLGRELRSPTEVRVVKARRIRVAPQITTSGLRRRYPAYVSIDRDTFTLRLFRSLRHVRTYQVAVGAAGFDTPRGIRRVHWKDQNPSWTAPNRPWAYPYQGQTFPPGDPNNPLRGWFLALGDGYGIHGTSEEWTIGTRASHGCIRMRERDINRLAPLVPVGTPVRIH
jgi:lipoprotein-anchoring transpeptidase ErfK/SrfK